MEAFRHMVYVRLADITEHGEDNDFTKKQNY